MNKMLRSALQIAAILPLIAFAGAAAAQVSADKLGKSTSGSTPSATPVTPGAPGRPLSGNGDDATYGRYWSSVDANGDGRVTREEYLAYHGTRYDRYDTRKQGYYDRQTLRELYLEREMSRTDGHPSGTPMNATTKK